MNSRHEMEPGLPEASIACRIGNLPDVLLSGRGKLPHMDSTECGPRVATCNARPACDLRAFPMSHFRVIALLVLAASFAGTSKAQSAGLGSPQSSGTQNPATPDCADPLLATSAQCTGANQGDNNFNPEAQNSGQNSQGRTSSSPPNGNYSDIEELSRQGASRNLPQQSILPPEPLTEFQNFVVSTSGQSLPIYGAELFRRVPSTFAPLDMTPVPSDYVIGPGDELRIRVWGQVNFPVNVRVDRSGEVFLPQVGSVHVAGIPISGLEAHLREAIGRVYHNFNLTADLGQIRSIQVYLSGEARRPGLYTVSSLSTLVDALFTSGGPSLQGSMRHVQLRRNGTIVTDFDLYNLLIEGDKSKDVKLESGDVIFIPPVGPQAAVLGSVKHPAIYELREGEPLGSLLRDAGGPSAVASQARVSIERVQQHQSRQAMEVAYDSAGLETPVADADLVRVFSIVPKYQMTVTLRGNTANPGHFAWHAGMHISDLIPDKDSLITRNYWWRRARLGLPAPEEVDFPTPSIVQWNESTPPYASPSRFPNPYQSPSLNQGQNQLPNQVPFYSQNPYSYQDSTLNQDQNANLIPDRSFNQYQSQNPSQTPYPSQSSSQYPSQYPSQAPYQNPNQNFNAQQRAGGSSLGAAESGAANSRFPGNVQHTTIRQLAPEIDWDYAVIERMDEETLKSIVIPFDLGKLILSHDASQDLELKPGDIVSIFSQADFRVPIAHQTKQVTLDGEFAHAGVYTAQEGETLRHLVERAGGLTPNAYLYGSEFTRLTTRAIQQARIDEYVQSLSMQIERSNLALSASAVSQPQDLASSAAATANERDLIASLRQIRATGRVVLRFSAESEGVNSIPDVTLEDGDFFVVPPVPSSINVVGAVYDQNSFLYLRGAKVGTFLGYAGGANRDGDSKHEFIIRANGDVVSHERAKAGLWSGGNDFSKLPMNPGDTIVVPEKTFRPTALRNFIDYSQLFSQFALGAAALSILK
jgi:protein involved in polysaccharide export with SLBB domain